MLSSQITSSCEYFNERSEPEVIELDDKYI